MLPNGTILPGQSHALCPVAHTGAKPMTHQSTVAVANRPQPSAVPNAFSPHGLAGLELRNRIVMAPMTRSRAAGGNVPSPHAATYYAQRASAGLIVTEATQVSPQGAG